MHGVSKDRQRGKKKPELKIIDDSEEVHQLNYSPEEAGIPRKKATLRRSQEKVALVRDLTEQESPQPTLDTSEEVEIQSPTTTPPFQIPPAFFALTVGAFLLLLGVGIFLAFGGRNPGNRDAAQDRARKKVELAQQEQIEARNLVSKLTSALSQYSSATTVEEKLLSARQPERVRPLMEGYYETRELSPLSGAKLIGQYTLPIKSLSFVVLSASFDDAPNKVFLAEVDNDLNVRIDWVSDVCFQPVDIAQYIAEKPSEAVDLRIFANPDNFYVYEFSDSEKYQCFKLTFRDNDEILYGYTERNSLTGKKLQEHFQIARRHGKRNPEPLSLKVRFLENSMSERGVFIEEFIAPRWANINELNNE